MPMAMKVEIDASIKVTNSIDFQVEGVIVQKFTLVEEVVGLFSLFRAVQFIGCSRDNIYPVCASVHSEVHAVRRRTWLKAAKAQLHAW